MLVPRLSDKVDGPHRTLILPCSFQEMHISKLVSNKPFMSEWARKGAYKEDLKSMIHVIMVCEVGAELSFVL